MSDLLVGGPPTGIHTAACIRHVTCGMHLPLAALIQQSPVVGCGSECHQPEKSLLPSCSTDTITMLHLHLHPVAHVWTTQVPSLCRLTLVKPALLLHATCPRQLPVSVFDGGVCRTGAVMYIGAAFRLHAPTLAGPHSARLLHAPNCVLAPIWLFVASWSKSLSSC